MSGHHEGPCGKVPGRSGHRKQLGGRVETTAFIVDSEGKARQGRIEFRTG